MSYKKINIEKLDGDLIDKLLGTILRLGVKSLPEIKQVISDSNYFNSSKQDYASRIVSTILQTKLKGDKIVLRDGIFSKPLKVYLSRSDVSIKILTNDMLFLQMILKKIVDVQGLNERIQNLLFESTSTQVTVTSQNFMHELPSKTGLIQDYDSGFSAICTLDLRDNVGVIKKIIQDKPNAGTVMISDVEYQYFGNSDIAIICPVDLSNDEIFQKTQDQQFFITENNRFKLGEKTIGPDKKIRFMYQTFFPETFCPAFWIVPAEIKCTFLYTIEVDYNDLYEYVYNSINDSLEWPVNIVYWDTLNQFFDFCAVLGLTHPVLNEELRKALIRRTTQFYKLSPTINKIKSVQMKIERVFHDYLNSFVNNSGYDRFSNLYSKAIAIVGEDDKVKKLPDYFEAKELLLKVSGAEMIRNQLSNNDIRITLNNLIDVLRKYLKGTDASTILSEVRKVAKEIVSFLPADSCANACFPFIVAPGPLLGEQIVYNDKKSDIIMKKVDDQITKKKKESKKKKEEVDKRVNIILKSDDKIKEYIKKYLLNRPAKSKPKLDSLDLQMLQNIIYRYLFINQNRKDYRVILEKAEAAALDKVFQYKKDSLIEEFIKDFYAASRATPKKKATVSSKFFDTINELGIVFNVVKTNNNDESDEEMVVETKMETTEDKKTKKEDKKETPMDLDDEDWDSEGEEIKKNYRLRRLRKGVTPK